MYHIIIYMLITCTDKWQILKLTKNLTFTRFTINPDWEIETKNPHFISNTCWLLSKMLTKTHITFLLWRLNFILPNLELCIVGIMSRGRGQFRLAPRPTLLQTDPDNAQDLHLQLLWKLNTTLSSLELCIAGIMCRGRGQSRLAPRPAFLQTDSGNAQNPSILDILIDLYKKFTLLSTFILFFLKRCLPY